MDVGLRVAPGKAERVSGCDAAFPWEGVEVDRSRRVHCPRGRSNVLVLVLENRFLPPARQLMQLWAALEHGQVRVMVDAQAGGRKSLHPRRAGPR